ncbi:MAG: radical SAM protein [Planctomycetes bacterium]|nr:radical SAM protein [Planctomycetota bacterium]
MLMSGDSKGTPSTMEVAFLILTTQCNRRCSYCFYETGYQGRASPDRILLIDDPLLSALQKAGVNKLILSGGEPMILPGIIGLVNTMVDKGFFTLLLSNGLDLAGGKLQRLVDSGLHALSVSLDSLAEGAEAKAPWEVLQKAADFKELHTSAITPITRANVSAIPQIVDRIHAMGLNLLLQPVFIPQDHPLYPTLSLHDCDEKESDLLLEAVQAWEDAYGASFYSALLKNFYQEGGLNPLTCQMGTHCMVVDVTGDCYPCFHRKDLCGGNLLDGDPAEVIACVQRKGVQLQDASCFGEHCISLFSHL